MVRTMGGLGAIIITCGGTDEVDEGEMRAR